jgi:hypothetical protein
MRWPQPAHRSAENLARLRDRQTTLFATELVLAYIPSQRRKLCMAGEKGSRMTWLALAPSEAPIAEEIEKQTDRATGIIGAAFIENRLEEAIKSRTRLRTKPEAKAAKQLFGLTRPLSSFAAKIDIGLLLGVYLEEVHADLHRVREIRNEFAHEMEPRDFTCPKIQDLCKLLWLPHHLFIVDTHAHHAVPTDPRGLYIHTVKLLLSVLRRATISPVPPPEPLWG